MLDSLSRTDRMRLMKFVCSFAWADLQVRDSERSFVVDLIHKLKLDQAETNQVEGWLQVPPPPEDVDPFGIPHEHRQIFLDTMLALSAADGEISSAETENFNLLSQLVR